MTTDTTVSNLIINTLTKAQYEEIDSPSDIELYLTPDESLSADDLKTVNGESIVGSGNIDIPSGSGHNLFDIVQKDHILTFEESKGFAQLGTYVYKSAVASSRYGYPDFYDTVVKEFEDENNTTTTVGGVTVSVNSNGHMYYNIADKAAIDTVYASTGAAWYYGVDKENERIFLPRNDWFFQNGDSLNVGKFNEAGLPNITGRFGACTYSTPNRPQAGAFEVVESRAYGTTGKSALDRMYDFDASAVSSVYGNSDSVQPPSVNTVPYMVVGNTKVENAATDITEITTSENDTIPLGASQYSGEVLQSSLGWLKSSGQWNSGSVYTTFYNEAVNNIGQSFAAGKIAESTGTYTDYDLVINQDEMTFRLPLLNGAENEVDYTKGQTVSPAGNEWVPVEKKSWVVLWGTDSYVEDYFVYVSPDNGGTRYTVGHRYDDTNSNLETENFSFDVPAGWSFSTYAETLRDAIIYPYKGNGSLYFKVANAVENLELLDVAEVMDAIQAVGAKPHIIDEYFKGNSWYRLWSNGWCEQGGQVQKPANTDVTVTLLKAYNNTAYNITVTMFYGVSSSTTPHVMTISNDNFVIGQSNSKDAATIWSTKGYIT